MFERPNFGGSNFLMASSPKKQIRRSANDITRLLKDQSEKGYTATAFCARHGISKQTYYNWRKQYGPATLSPNSFIPLEVATSELTGSTPFCDITISGSTSIRFYYAVDAKFIKSLNLY